jgi:hypothetical protein
MKASAATLTRAAAPRIDASAIRRGVYWTAHNTGGISEAAAIRSMIQARPHEIPHEGICGYACKSPKSLLRALRVLSNWKRSHFDHTHHKIARVEILPDGFIFTAFDTFEEACEAHQRDQA